MKKLVSSIVIVLALIFIVWLLPFFRCEYLTARHGDEFDFESAYNANSAEFFKVMSYNQNEAEIYYVGKNFSIGEILHFKRDGEKWVYSDAGNTVWSALGGTADDSIWPYFWHNWKYVLMRKVNVDYDNCSFSRFWVEDDKVYLECEITITSNLEHDVSIEANFGADEGKLLKDGLLIGYDKELKSDSFHIEYGTNKFTVIFVGDYGGTPQKSDEDFYAIWVDPYVH